MDLFTDRLSEYLDDELTPGERDAIEAHLRDCGDCRRTLDELRGVMDRAASLPARPPETDLWPGIESRLDARGERLVPIDAFRARPDTREARRFSFTAAQLAAAAAVLVVTSAGVAWLVGTRTIDTVMPTASTAPSSAAADAQPVAVPVANFADAQYDAAVADLQRALEEGRGRLDPKTIEILETNLKTIDQAIEQAREALIVDPANTYLNSYLADARRRKLDVLRDATAALANLSS